MLRTILSPFVRFPILSGGVLITLILLGIFSQIRNLLLVIFDVEGVLLDEEYLPILAEKLNKEDEIWEITKAWGC